MIRFLGAMALAALSHDVSGCHRKNVDTPPPPPLVRTSVVAKSEAPPVTLRGPVVAGSRLRLGFKAPGLVKAVYVKDGDTVRKGQLLARLDSTEAAAHARAAQANRDKAKREWQKSVNLADVGALSASIRDDAKSQLDGSDANLALAWDALRGTELKSPVNGTVFRRVAEPGETLAGGAPVLIVEETERPVVKLGVTDRDLKQLKRTQKVDLVLEDSGETLPGEISTLSATPDAADGLYAVEVVPVRPANATRAKGRKSGETKIDDGGLRLGTLVTVRFTPASEAAIRIPLEALVHRHDKDWVFLVEGSEAPLARMRAIGVGRSEGKDMIVTSGLQAGEQIITEGAYFLMDRQAVRVGSEGVSSKQTALK